MPAAHSLYQSLEWPATIDAACNEAFYVVNGDVPLEPDVGVAGQGARSTPRGFKHVGCQLLEPFSYIGGMRVTSHKGPRKRAFGNVNTKLTIRLELLFVIELIYCRLMGEIGVKGSVSFQKFCLVAR